MEALLSIMAILKPRLDNKCVERGAHSDFLRLYEHFEATLSLVNWEWLTMDPRRGGMGKRRCGHNNAEEEIRALANIYRRFPILKVQEWLEKIDVEAREARDNIEEE